MVPWNELQTKELSKIELREKYIASQAIVIQAFGRIGAQLFENTDLDMEKYLARIEKINWKRNTSIWMLRAIRSNGRMINSENAILLTANAIKQIIGLPLTIDEQTCEETFRRNNIIKVGE